MSDKFDDIEGLFKESFENFEPEVDPSVWQNISSQIGSSAPTPDASPASSGGSVAGGAAASTAVKVTMIAATAGLLSIGGYFLFSGDEVTDNDPIQQEVTVADEAEEAVIEANEEVAVVESSDDNVREVISASTQEPIEVKIADEPVDQAPNEENMPVVSEVTQTDQASVQKETTSLVIKESSKEETPANEVREEPTGNERRDLEASIYASLKSGKLPLAVRFENRGSTAEDVSWYINGELVDRGGRSTNYTFEEVGKYWVVLDIGDGRMHSRDSVEITVESDVVVTIPNIFTPNGDGINDAFAVDSEGLESLSCTIMTITGNIVFKHNLNGHWDGRDMGGNEMPAGTYLYYIEYTDVNGVTKAEKGTVQLQR